MGGGRAQDYGIGVNRDEALAWVNSNVLVIPMVEDIEAVGTWTTSWLCPGPTCST